MLHQAVSFYVHILLFVISYGPFHCIPLNFLFYLYVRRFHLSFTLDCHRSLSTVHVGITDYLFVLLYLFNRLGLSV